MQKGFLTKHVVLIAIIVIGVVGYFLFIRQYSVSPTDSSKMTSPVSQDETADWKTYRNEEYGFEVKYPARLEMKTVENWTSFYFCEGSIKKYSDNLGPEGVSEVCEGMEYHLFVAMHEQKFDPNNLPDNTELRKPVKKLSINGKDFYLARHEVYTYGGWDVYTSLREKTLQLGFSGDGFVLQQSSIISKKEEEVIKSILSTFKFIN